MSTDTVQNFMSWVSLQTSIPPSHSIIHIAIRLS
jgi:hypothetical protein